MEEEIITILIMSIPQSSGKYGILICTAGINKNNEWRRLWNITPQIKIKYDIHRWDIFKVKTEKTTDKRFETRRLDIDTLTRIGIVPKRERRRLVNSLVDNSFDNLINNGRSLGIINPIIKNLNLITKNDGNFGNFYPKYIFNCINSCNICEENNKYHEMKCRDWGSNELCRKYKNKINGKELVYRGLFYDKINNYDIYFGVGTHMHWQDTWMIVSLFWFKKKDIREQYTEGLF